MSDKVFYITSGITLIFFCAQRASRAPARGASRSAGLEPPSPPKNDRLGRTERELEGAAPIFFVSLCAAGAGRHATQSPGDTQLGSLPQRSR